MPGAPGPASGTWDRLTQTPNRLRLGLRQLDQPRFEQRLDGLQRLQNLMRDRRVHLHQGQRLHRLFARALAAEGEFLMPADDYGFSRRFAWLNDAFAVDTAALGIAGAARVEVVFLEVPTADGVKV